MTDYINGDFEVTDAQIKHMVDRFLMWKLPQHFNPDGGVSFEAVASKGTPHEFRREPVGTNLFDAMQALDMVRHMLEELPVQRDWPYAQALEKRCELLEAALAPLAPERLAEIQKST